MIYFIKDGDFIKIGHTDGDPKDDLNSFQEGNPSQLTLIGTMDGDVATMEHLHGLFDHSHLARDWFFFSRAVRSFIEKRGAVFEREKRSGARTERDVLAALKNGPLTTADMEARGFHRFSLYRLRDMGVLAPEKCGNPTRVYWKAAPKACETAECEPE